MNESPTIIVIEGDDLMVFQDVFEAASWLEAVDVRQDIYEIVDENGEEYRATVSGEDVVVAPVVHPDTNEEMFINRIKKFAAAVFPGVKVPDDLKGACKSIVLLVGAQK